MLQVDEFRMRRAARSSGISAASSAWRSKARRLLAEPAGNGWDSPHRIGTTTVRIEVFVDDPDEFVARAVQAGADGSVDPVRDHEAPWGKHRQGGFFDPFGHLWLVGDKSPLRAFPAEDPVRAPSSRS